MVCVWRLPLLLVTTLFVACSFTALDGFSGGASPADAGDEAEGASGPSVVKLVLVDTTTNAPVAGFDPIQNLAKLPFSTQPKVTVEAITSPPSVGSVRYVVSGAMSFTQTENASPYTINDEAENERYTPWTPKPGSYDLFVTAYPESGAKGTPGGPLHIQFVVE